MVERGGRVRRGESFEDYNYGAWEGYRDPKTLSTIWSQCPKSVRTQWNWKGSPQGAAYWEVGKMAFNTQLACGSLNYHSGNILSLDTTSSSMGSMPFLAPSILGLTVWLILAKRIWERDSDSEQVLSLRLKKHCVLPFTTRFATHPRKLTDTRADLEPRWAEPSTDQLNPSWTTDAWARNKCLTHVTELWMICYAALL